MAGFFLNALLALLALPSFQGYALPDSPLVAASQDIGDRLLVEIDGSFFSQYQLECYHLIEAGLSDTNWKGEFQTPSASNWSTILDAFVSSMVIQLESQRLGSFYPSDDVAKRSLERIEALAAKDQGFRLRMSELAMDRRTLVRTIGSVLQVMAYKAGKVSDRDGGDASKQNKTWLAELKERVVVRYMAQSQDYKPINPRKASGSEDNGPVNAR